MTGNVETAANTEVMKADTAAALATERSNKRKFSEMPSLRVKMEMWISYNTKDFASLTKVVQRLLATMQRAVPPSGTQVCTQPLKMISPGA
jgi:hypothetical protein